MKKTLIAAGVALSIPFLSGCEPYEDPAATAADNAEIDSQSRVKMAEEDAELKAELAKLKEKDPTVKDMYYGVDEQGNKVVHIVREVKDENGNPQAANSVLPFVTGMLLGQMMANNAMMSAAYMNSTRYSSFDDERRRRNSAVGGYAGYTRSRVSKSYVSSRPSSAYSISSRSSGAFAGGSSARAGGYSSGG